MDLSSAAARDLSRYGADHTNSMDARRSRDEWSRVDFRSRAAAAICLVATTLVAAVALTTYVAAGFGFAEGALLEAPPREGAHACPPRYIHQIYGLKARRCRRRGGEGKRPG